MRISNRKGDLKDQSVDYDAIEALEDIPPVNLGNFDPVLVENTETKEFYWLHRCFVDDQSVLVRWHLPLTILADSKKPIWRRVTLERERQRQREIHNEQRGTATGQGE